MKVDNIGLGLKVASKIVGLQEGGAGLSHIKFLQDSATGLVPKALFSRSKADLVENSFLELSESALVYYGPGIVGEGFRKLYSKGLSSELKNKISTPAVELLKKNSPENQKILPIKAAISLSSLLIPLTEFTLNYIKNLMTLKMFKQGDFTDIAKLDKNKKVDTSKNKKVEDSAKKNILTAALVFGSCLATSAVLAKKGQNSKVLQNFSELILAPGNKLFKNNDKMKNFANKYFSLDFADNLGKLTMSKGQLTSCVLIGAAGYFGAAKDRGKQNFLEVLFRFPLVGFYTICGNELLENGFKKMLVKAGKCSETIGKDMQVPLLRELPELAKKIQKEKGGNYDEIYKKLLKQKTLISGLPILFGIGVMGFFVAGVSRFFTQYRYDKETQKQVGTKIYTDVPDIFRKFIEKREI